MTITEQLETLLEKLEENPNAIVYIMLGDKLIMTLTDKEIIAN